MEILKNLFFREKVLESPTAVGEILYETKNQESSENYPVDDFRVEDPIKGSSDFYSRSIRE